MIQIPLAYSLTLVAGLGPHGVFWSVAIAESVLAVLAALVFRRGAWKRTTV
jgi:Na+-driven multidrug efflux pump